LKDKTAFSRHVLAEQAEDKIAQADITEVIRSDRPTGQVPDQIAETVSLLNLQQQGDNHLFLCVLCVFSARRESFVDLSR
jgi:hypothetical protein